MKSIFSWGVASNDCITWCHRTSGFTLWTGLDTLKGRVLVVLDVSQHKKSCDGWTSDRGGGGGRHSLISLKKNDSDTKMNRSWILAFHFKTEIGVSMRYCITEESPSSFVLEVYLVLFVFPRASCGDTEPIRSESAARREHVRIMQHLRTSDAHTTMDQKGPWWKHSETSIILPAHFISCQI